MHRTQGRSSSDQRKSSGHDAKVRSLMKEKRQFLKGGLSSGLHIGPRLERLSTVLLWQLGSCADSSPRQWERLLLLPSESSSLILDGLAFA